jgi:hypothetical protein
MSKLSGLLLGSKKSAPTQNSSKLDIKVLKSFLSSAAAAPHSIKKHRFHS